MTPEDALTPTLNEIADTLSAHLNDEAAMLARMTDLAFPDAPHVQRLRARVQRLRSICFEVRTLIEDLNDEVA